MQRAPCLAASSSVKRENELAIVVHPLAGRLRRFVDPLQLEKSGDLAHRCRSVVIANANRGQEPGLTR